MPVTRQRKKIKITSSYIAGRYEIYAWKFSISRIYVAPYIKLHMMSTAFVTADLCTKILSDKQAMCYIELNT